jgi:hypothetical protein
MGVSVAFPGTWANGVPYLERTKNWGHGRHGTQWASLVSYGLTVQALKDFLPVDARLNERPVRHHTLAVAQRCPVGIAGGHGRDWEEKQRHFEVIAGKSSRTFRRNEEDSHPSNKCFAFVQISDTKPKRRLFEVVKSQVFRALRQLAREQLGTVILHLENNHRMLTCCLMM